MSTGFHFLVFRGGYEVQALVRPNVHPLDEASHAITVDSNFLGTFLFHTTCDETILVILIRALY